MQHQSFEYLEIVGWVKTIRKELNLQIGRAQRDYAFLPAWVKRHSSQWHNNPYAAFLYEQLAPTIEGFGAWKELKNPCILKAVYDVVLLDRKLSGLD